MPVPPVPRIGRRSEIENLGAWLTTVVARVCLNMLRARRARSMRNSRPAVFPSRSSIALTGWIPSTGPSSATPSDWRSSLLETLAPTERVAFVLHDVFALPFDEIAPILGRTPTATRQLASRARRRVRGVGPSGDQRRSSGAILRS